MKPYVHPVRRKTTLVRTYHLLKNIVNCPIGTDCSANTTFAARHRLWLLDFVPYTIIPTTRPASSKVPNTSAQHANQARQQHAANRSVRHESQRGAGISVGPSTWHETCSWASTINVKLNNKKSMFKTQYVHDCTVLLYCVHNRLLLLSIRLVDNISTTSSQSIL